MEEFREKRDQEKKRLNDEQKKELKNTYKTVINSIKDLKACKGDKAC